MSRTTSSLFEGYEALRTHCAWKPLPEIAAVRFTGADRLEWLQGQVTQDLRDLQSGQAREFCLCQPTGQMVTFGVLGVSADSLVMLVPAETVDDVLARVDDMVILEDVQAAVEPGFVGTIQGPSSAEALQALGGSALFLPSARAESVGFDVLVVSAAALHDVLAGFPECSDSVWNAARLEAGQPLWGWEATSKTLPPELGDAFLARTVAQGKGCYTGQEVLARIHSRGHTNRTWVALVAEAALESGNLVVRGESEVGAVTTAAYSPDLGDIAGAFLRNEAAKEGEIVHVITPQGTVRAEVAAMPLLRPA